MGLEVPVLRTEEKSGKTRLNVVVQSLLKHL